MDARGWVPATAGNLSVRLAADRIAITRSGPHKGFLAAGDIMQVDLDGRALTDARPSAETGLHCQIYRDMPGVGAVLHGHSPAATAVSRAVEDCIVLEGFELLKALGQPTHAARVTVPVVDNDQDIGRLAARVGPLLGDAPGYVIRGHGVYVWGDDMERALWRLEALEFLLACAWEERPR